MKSPVPNNTLDLQEMLVASVQMLAASEAEGPIFWCCQPAARLEASRRVFGGSQILGRVSAGIELKTARATRSLQCTVTIG